jgi:hypothetical protein
VKAYGQEDYVDERLAPLAKALWRCRVHVLQFSVDHTGRACLDFSDTEEATGFMNLVAVYDDKPDSLYQRIAGGAGVEDSWEYWVDPFDGSTLNDCQGRTGVVGRPADFLFLPSVSFPLSDVPLIVESLAAHRPEAGAPGRGGPDQVARGGR